MGDVKEQPHCKVSEYGTKYWYLNGYLHREDGPAREYPSGRARWALHNKEVDPETLVDLWLSRGTFCYYDEEADEMRFE